MISFTEDECYYLLCGQARKIPSTHEDKAHTPTPDHSLLAVLKDFDFLNRAIFPSIHDKLYQKNPNIFSPAVPETFYKNYLSSIQFLNSIESLFLTQDDPMVSLLQTLSH